MEAITRELNRRISLWKEIKQYPEGKVPRSFVEKKRIYKGQRGTYRDQETTKSLTNGDEGVTVSVRCGAAGYANEWSRDGVNYYYPPTDGQKTRAANDILATKHARNLDLPIFVVIEERTSGFREVKLGWVMDFDDEAGVFLISFAEKRPSYSEKRDDDPFQLVDENGSKTSKTRRRPNQQRFRFQVVKNYGRKCAVCDVTHKIILDASHLRGKGNNGSDDWRNGIVLCKNHHSAFDEGLFRICPKSRRITGITRKARKDIKITEAKLNTATGKIPHVEALRWRWKHPKSTSQ